MSLETDADQEQFDVPPTAVEFRIPPEDPSFHRQNTDEVDNTSLVSRETNEFDNTQKRSNDDDDPVTFPKATVREKLYNVRLSEMTPLGGSTRSLRRRRDDKVVGMKDALKDQEDDPFESSVERDEDKVRKETQTNPVMLMLLGNLAAVKVFLFYLVTIDTLVVLAMSIGLTCYWYFTYQNDPDWGASSMNWFLVGFAVVNPMSASITLSFNRREQALMRLSQVRSYAYHIYLGHAMWDWDADGGRAGCRNMDWLKHSDDVMTQLIGIGDELCRFLTLPAATRSRHRMTRTGRKEAVQTMGVAYRLFDSLSTQRMTRLSRYAENIKTAGLPSGEISRIRQYERWMGESIEALRQYKMYRTPQALRSFARVFTIVLPPFYAPTFAQVGIEVNSLGMGIFMAVIVVLALSALFESIQVLEDPFVAYLTLDGIDVREELEVLYWQQLVDTRQILFPDAPPYPKAPRRALTPYAKDSKASLRSLDADLELGHLRSTVPKYHRVRSYSIEDLLEPSGGAGLSVSEFSVGSHNRRKWAFANTFEG